MYGIDFFISVHKSS